MNALLKSQWVRRLEIIFQILAWSTLIFVLLNLFNSIRLLMGPRSPFEPFTTAHETFLIQFKLLMAGLGDAFFAFLMSSALSMIQKQKPISSNRIDLFLKIACFGFFVEGIFGIVGWFKLLESRVSLDPNTPWLVYYFNLTPSLMSCLYAVTLYILFHHFFKLITFKSEVI